MLQARVQNLTLGLRKQFYLSCNIFMHTCVKCVDKSKLKIITYVKGELQDKKPKIKITSKPADLKLYALAYTKSTCCKMKAFNC